MGNKSRPSRHISFVLRVVFGIELGEIIRESVQSFTCTEYSAHSMHLSFLEFKGDFIILNT